MLRVLVDKNSTRLCMYVGFSGNFVPTFREKLSIPHTVVNRVEYWTLKKGSANLVLTVEDRKYQFLRKVGKKLTLFAA